MQILQNLEQNLNCLIGAGLNACFTMWLLTNIATKYIILCRNLGSDYKTELGFILNKIS
jgi:hypothetical protein